MVLGAHQVLLQTFAYCVLSTSIKANFQLFSQSFTPDKDKVKEEFYIPMEDSQGKLGCSMVHEQMTVCCPWFICDIACGLSKINHGSEAINIKG